MSFLQFLKQMVLVVHRLMYLEDTLESRKKRLDQSKSVNDEQADKLRETCAAMEAKCQDLTQQNGQLKEQLNNLEYEVKH